MTTRNSTTQPTHEDVQTIQKLLVGVIGLIDTFSAEQRGAALFGFDDARRLDWDIIPKPDRVGVSMHNLDRHQKVVVLELVDSRSHTRSTPRCSPLCNSSTYYGRGRRISWGRRATMAHLRFLLPQHLWPTRVRRHLVNALPRSSRCLNITIVNQHWILTTPSALGQQPMIGSGVLIPMSDDEGLGFELLDSLNDDQRSLAVIHDVAPADFVSRQVPLIGAIEYPDHYDLGMPQYQITTEDRKALALVREQPSGISADRLVETQQALLTRLIDTYLARLPARAAGEYRAQIDADGPTKTHFAWAGGLVRGEPHYFRVQTRLLLIEMVNAVDSGNHLHSVIRDFEHDFAHDSLRDHAAHLAKHGSHLSTRTTSSEGTELRANDWSW